MQERKREVIFGLFIVFLDQFSKILVQEKHFFILNKGWVWNVLPAPAGFPVLLIINVLILLSLAIFIFKGRYRLGIILVFSGGISNLLDRFLYGGVIDFIKIPLIPAFNFADIAISFGVAIFLFLGICPAAFRTGSPELKTGSGEKKR